MQFTLKIAKTDMYLLYITVSIKNVLYNNFFVIIQFTNGIPRLHNSFVSSNLKSITTFFYQFL